MKKQAIIALAVGALIICCGKGKPTAREFPHLNKLRPANQYFHIDPTGKSIIKAEKGSVFTIEPDSFTLPDNFQKGDKIEIHLIEVTKSLEFAALPVSLEFKREGKDTLFESAGMFFIDASHKEKPLSLQKGKKIRVKFRTDVSGDKFFVYNYDKEKGWLKHGHNHEVRIPETLVAQAAGGDSEMILAQKKPAAPARPAAPAAPAAAARPRPMSADEERVWKKKRKAIDDLYREYKIDQLTWWNFDYPKPSLTCLKGTISGSDSQYYSVTVFSKSEKGAYSLYLEKNFKISFYRNSEARLFAIDEKGNLAITPFFETPDKKGHHKTSPDSECYDVGPLKIKKLPEEVEKDSGKLKNYLQKAGN